MQHLKYLKFLKRTISIEDLSERWGLTEGDIKVFIDDEKRKNPELEMWYPREIRQCPDGSTVTVARPAYYLSRSIFDLDDILRLEAKYPGLVGTKLEWGGRTVGDPTPVVKAPPPPDPLPAQDQILQPATPSPRTERANVARAEKKLAAWKELFPCMVRIYARMEPGRQYTRKEVATLFEAEGVEVRVNKEGKPTGAMFGYFWQVFTNSGLPIDDLSNCRWSPDVSAATTTDPLPDDN